MAGSDSTAVPRPLPRLPPFHAAPASARKPAIARVAAPWPAQRAEVLGTRKYLAHIQPMDVYEQKVRRDLRHATLRGLAIMVPVWAFLGWVAYHALLGR